MNHFTNTSIQRFVQIESSFAFTFKWAGQIDAILITGAGIAVGGAFIDVCSVAPLKWHIASIDIETENGKFY